MELMAAVRTTLTLEEFLQLPERPGKRELLKGEMIELPPAKRQHNQIAHRLYERLKDAVAAAGAGGEVYHEMGYQMGPREWLQPDVSISHAGQPGRDYFEGSPRLAVEVVSESNSAEEIDGKVEDYLAHGAVEVWVIYPERRHMWIYRSGGQGKVHAASFVSTLFEDERFDLDEILGS
jgi:Uma2 family endonuclease